MITILDQARQDKDPTEKRKRYIAKLMVAKPPFDDDMKNWDKDYQDNVD